MVQLRCVGRTVVRHLSSDGDGGPACWRVAACERLVWLSGSSLRCTQVVRCCFNVRPAPPPVRLLYHLRMLARAHVASQTRHDVCRAALAPLLLLLVVEVVVCQSVEPDAQQLPQPEGGPETSRMHSTMQHKKKLLGSGE
eukprot:COSAG01_NODE_18662_length_1061_cov_1.438669_2_plen_140_part_00